MRADLLIILSFTSGLYERAVLSRTLRELYLSLLSRRSSSLPLWLSRPAATLVLSRSLSVKSVYRAFYRRPPWKIGSEDYSPKSSRCNKSSSSSTYDERCARYIPDFGPDANLRGFVSLKVISRVSPPDPTSHPTPSHLVPTPRLSTGT